MKFCILKPVAWNDNNYKAPSGGRHSGKDFVCMYGYGHEEWNNHPSMHYGGRTYFHSEANGRLLNEANGNLCILLIAVNNGVSHIVGVGAQVATNSKADMSAIAKILHLYDRWQEVWATPGVQSKFNGDNGAFLTHWKNNYEWIKWSCPTSHYHWFSKPIPIITSKVTDKEKVVSMYSSYQLISPAVARDLLAGALPSKHPIWAWLAEGPFLDGKTVPSGAQKKSYSALVAQNNARKGSNRPTDTSYTYWIEGNRTVNPKHAPLQADFVLHLESRGIACEQNTPDYIDLMYMDKKKLVITEVKPAEYVGTKYAIRAAIGQLLEYRHTISKPAALLHIVLDEEPKKNEVQFVQSLGFMLSYKDKSGKFITL